MIVLGIDSGVEKTGFSIFEKKVSSSSNFALLNSGLIKTSIKHTRDKRLQAIYKELLKIVKLYKPEIMVLEQLFFFTNQKTAIQVSQAQGICLLLAAQNNIKVEYLTPLQIKQIVTGYGKADKKAIQKMIELTLKTSKPIKQDDEADAIACGMAYCLINKNLI
ncbi:MAG: crossover junction endodeoxyribonuclease RuvC [bacterium]